VPATLKLSREVFLDYGREFSGGFRMSSDSDGLSDRLYEQSVAVHAGPANRIRLGLEQRTLSNERDLGWRRVNLGWSSQLTSRLSAYASGSQVRYSGDPHEHAFFGDGALNFAVNDRLRLSAGGGNMPMDAFRAVENRVKGSFYY